MYFVKVTFSAQRSTAPSNIASTEETRRTSPRLPSVRVRSMPEPTIAAVDALVGPATPHFAYQLRARVRELVPDLPPEHPAPRHADEQTELLDRLRHASSNAPDRGPGPRPRP